MRRSYRDPRNDRTFFQLMLAYLPCTLLLVWAAQLFSRPLGALLLWAGCCVQAFAVSWLLWHKYLRGVRWPSRRIVIDAPLLVSRSHMVHHAQCPLQPVVTARMTSGPSVLLLATCAMLTLPDENRDAASQAVMDFLAPLKLEQETFQRKYPCTGVLERYGLTWSVVQDGAELRAYARGAAMDVMQACELIWDGAARTMNDEERYALQDAWMAEELPPMGFAMAQVEDGEPVRPVFLGAMMMERALLPYARAEVQKLQRRGHEVAVLGLEPVSAMRIGAVLRCDTVPSAADDALQLTCSGKMRGEWVYQLPDGMRPSQAVSYLSINHRRLLYRPLQCCLAMAGAALCCVLTDLPLAMLALLHVAMQAQSTCDPLSMRPQPRVQPLRLLYAAAAILLLPGMGWLVNTFMRDSGLAQPGADVLFLLPYTLLLAVQVQTRATTVKPSQTLGFAVLIGVVGAGLAIFYGTTLVGGLFALTAGSLCAMAAHVLFGLADAR